VVILFVVEVPLHPDGRTQLYDVAPGEEAAVYVCAALLHTAVAPLTLEGDDGMPVAETASVLDDDAPQ
jgi:hypothetical protein